MEIIVDSSNNLRRYIIWTPTKKQPHQLIQKNATHKDQEEPIIAEEK